MSRENLTRAVLTQDGRVPTQGEINQRLKGQ